MSANESRPAGAASEADEPTASVPDALRHALIGAPVEKQLDATLWRLVTGEIGLHDITPALAGFYSLGHIDGIRSCAARIERLEHEADVLYVQAFNPKDRAKVIRARMEAGAESYWQEFVAGDAQ